MNRVRRSRGAQLAVLGVVAFTISAVLSGCGGGDPGAGDALQGDAAGDYVAGEITVPGGESVSVDAESLLGSGQLLPDRENYEIASQQYTTTMDGEDPVIVGLIQATHTMHYRGYSEDENVTFVIGISAEKDPVELTRTRVYRGGEHQADFAGRSDQGVVAVLLEGELNTNVPRDSRVIGVDAVRGTEVWVKERGYPRSGDETAWFYASSSPDDCASEVQRYDVASGVVESSQSYLNTDVAAGGTCVTASSPKG